MTLDEAAAHVGALVVYRAGHPGAAPEEGVITSVNERYVFVRYQLAGDGVATRPEDIELAAPSWSAAYAKRQP